MLNLKSWFDNEMQKNRIQKILSHIYAYSLEDVLGITSDNRRVAYYHVQKCGGSSVNHVFYDLGYSNKILKLAYKKKLISKTDPKQIDFSKRGFITNKVSYRINKPFIKNGGFVITRSPNIFRKGKANFIHGHYLPLDLLDRQDTFSFTTLRDPLSRLISRYKMDYALYKENKLSHYADRIKISSVVDKPENYFQCLKESKTYKKEFYAILSTFSRNFDLAEAKNNLKKVDCILWQENLNKSFKRMIDKYSISLMAYKKDLQKVKNSSNKNITYPEISEELKFSLKKSLSDEYKLISFFK